MFSLYVYICLGYMFNVFVGSLLDRFECDCSILQHIFRTIFNVSAPYPICRGCRGTWMQALLVEIFLG